VSVVIVGTIRGKPVLTHASIVCGMLASLNSVNFDAEALWAISCTGTDNQSHN